MRASTPTQDRSAGWVLIVQLGCLIAVVSVLLLAMGRFSPPGQLPDSLPYVKLSQQPLLSVNALATPRTIGYPAFLKCVALYSPALRWLPVTQYLVHVGAVVLLAYALFRLGASPTLCTLLVAPILACDAVGGYVHLIMSEVPALSLAVATMACLLMGLKQQGRIWWWLLALGIFGTYQIRPVFLFLVPGVPMMALVLLPLLRNDARQLVKSVAIRTLLASTVPFLLFCTVRQVTVGHFGLVSFGGTNIIGIAGFLLDDELAARLPQDLRPLAERISADRSRWRRAEDGRREAPLQPAVTRRGGIAIPSYKGISGQYNKMVWGISYPAARSIYGDDQVAIDRALGRLSQEILRDQPVGYLIWVASAILEACAVVMSMFMMRGALIMLAAGVLLGALARWFREAVTVENRSASGDYAVLQIVSTLGLLFFLLNASLVALVEPMEPRYIRLAGVFLPSAVAGTCYLVAQRYVLGFLLQWRAAETGPAAPAKRLRPRAVLPHAAEAR